MAIGTLHRCWYCGNKVKFRNSTISANQMPWCDPCTSYVGSWREVNLTLYGVVVLYGMPLTKAEMTLRRKHVKVNYATNWHGYAMRSPEYDSTRVEEYSDMAIYASRTWTTITLSDLKRTLPNQG